MQRIPRRIVPGAYLGTTAAVLYEVGAGMTTTISAMTLTNTSSSVVEATVYLVPDGESPDATNAVLWARNLAPAESRIIGEAIAQTLQLRGTIQASASVIDSINMVASGYETIR